MWASNGNNNGTNATNRFNNQIMTPTHTRNVGSHIWKGVIQGMHRLELVIQGMRSPFARAWTCTVAGVSCGTDANHQLLNRGPTTGSVEFDTVDPVVGRKFDES